MTFIAESFWPRTIGCEVGVGMDVEWDRAVGAVVGTAEDGVGMDVEWDRAVDAVVGTAEDGVAVD